MRDPYNLQRFIDAQDSVYPLVCSELRHGCKTGHWMWFVFPQIKGLGYSTIAKKFAITSLEEARAYLDHLVLGSRLRECTQLVYQIEGRSIEQIFGYPDYLKLASSSFILIKNQRIGDYRFLCLDWREEWTLTFYV